MKLGCHLSVSKGFAAAAERAHTFGVASFQYFTKNPRGFKGKPLDLDDALRGVRLLERYQITAVGHAPYLLNLSTPEADKHRSTVESLLEDMRIARARGTQGLVVHCGKHMGEGIEAGLQRMADTLKEVFDRDETGVTLLLENTAGQGTELGMTYEELRVFMDVAPPERLGYCFDTCHALAAGAIDPQDPLGFAGFEDPDYLHRLQAIHLNDSKSPKGGRKDRHELIGQGYLGAAAIRLFLLDPRLAGLPFILETPVEQEEDYLGEMAACRQLIAKSA